MAKFGVNIQQLYSQMKIGAYSELTSLHHSLDVAVAEGYGWDKSVIDDRGEIIQRLVQLNLQKSAA